MTYGKLTFIALFLLIISSSQGRQIDGYASSKGEGLYFNQVEPKHTSLKFVSKKELGVEFRSADFYEDPYTEELFIKTLTNAKLIKDIGVREKGNKKRNKPEEFPITEDPGLFDVPPGEPQPNQNSPFIKKSTLVINNLVLEIPQNNDVPIRLQALNPNRPNFNLEKILKKINAIGLQTKQYTQTARTGYSFVYDRLFINDEDNNKFLIVWLDNDKLLANFLTNSGEWELTTPKIIHTEVKCLGSNGIWHQRDLRETINNQTLITELNCIKSGDKYYVGYSIESWGTTPCFNDNLVSCHILLLNSSLDIEKSVQIPDRFKISRKQDTPFASDVQMKIYGNKSKDTITAVIQSPNLGKDKLFVQCLNKDLSYLNSRLLYLSSTAHMFPNLIPVISVSGGSVLTYKENKSYSTEVYSQFVYNSGKPSVPVLIYSLDKKDSKILSTYYVKKDDYGNLQYYFIVEENKTQKIYLYQYQVSLQDFLRNMNYSINIKNWKADRTITAIEQMAAKTDKTTKTHKIKKFTKNQDKYSSQFLYTDNELRVLKYEENRDFIDQKQFRSFYYDTNGTLRMAKIVWKVKGHQIQSILVYYDSFGAEIWSIRIDKDGKTYTGYFETREAYSYFDEDKLRKPLEYFLSKD